MTNKESDHLRHLLTSFDAHALGEGDEVAGANVLATMAITLANLARRGSGIRTPDWKLIPVDCNVLASGSLTSNMVLDEVVTPVGHCQDNLLAHLDRLLKDNEAEEKRKERNLDRRWDLSGGHPANPGENSLLRLMTGDPELEPLIESHEDEWGEVLGSSPSEHFVDLIRRPRVFITGATPALLDQQLPGAHHSQALVAIGLNRASDAAKFGSICPSLMNGMIPAGPSGEAVRGRLLITDPGDVLPLATKADSDETAWLARLLWLVDGSAGPEFPSEDASDRIIPLPHLNARFAHAVRLILANRLNSRQPQPLIFECDFAKSQVRWMKFLNDMEGSLPGIRGTARCLLASLMFGFQRLIKVAEAPEGFKHYRDGIEALAKHLIRRMANARAAILFSANEARKLAHKRKILTKLDGEAMDTRMLYRGVHLHADSCRELLSELKGDGLIELSGDKWQRVEGATLPFDLN
ncbi:hypothetical protein [Haloferula sp.]|uniref:hypothetical protein n=1 Tax=Haloferula sp. TaxID=2497595 RepID=UPI003C741957